QFSLKRKCASHDRWQLMFVGLFSRLFLKNPGRTQGGIACELIFFCVRSCALYSLLTRRKLCPQSRPTKIHPHLLHRSRTRRRAAEQGETCTLPKSLNGSSLSTL